jgi:hypothetical protein
MSPMHPMNGTMACFTEPSWIQSDTLRPPEVCSPVRLPAGLAVFSAKGAFFPIAGDLDVRRRHPELLQILFGGLCSPFSEDEVVCTGSPLVAMAFDKNVSIGLRLEKACVRIQN